MTTDLTPVRRAELCAAALVAQNMGRALEVEPADFLLLSDEVERLRGESEARGEQRDEMIERVAERTTRRSILLWLARRRLWLRREVHRGGSSVLRDEMDALAWCIGQLAKEDDLRPDRTWLYETDDDRREAQGFVDGLLVDDKELTAAVDAMRSTEPDIRKRPIGAIRLNPTTETPDPPPPIRCMLDRGATPSICPCLDCAAAVRAAGAKP